MRAVKTALMISFAVFISIACNSTDTTNQNANQSAPPATNANASPTTAASVNSNSAVQVASTAANENRARPADDKGKEERKPASPAASTADGAALFVANKCTTCHGDNGKGNPKIKNVPDFTDAAWQKKESDAELISAIKKGKKPMPAYADKLSEDEIKALVAYVRTFAR